ncbi:MAG: hypothetical protein Q8910_20180 [Bacteroidota bacterium]|nr:hypothetical protein [Bacteroidota bacterium]
MRKIAVLVFLLSASIPAFNQDTLSSVSLKKIDYRLSYTGSILYPGFDAALEYPVHAVEIRKIFKYNRVKTIFKDRFAGLNLGFYHHPGFHDNLYLCANWTMRRTRANGFFTEFLPGLGYSRTFLEGTTYQVDDRGNVSKEKWAGYNYLLLSLGTSLGYDLSIKKKLPVSFFTQFRFIGMLPYNSTIYLRPMIQMGIMYHPAFVNRLMRNKNMGK